MGHREPSGGGEARRAVEDLLRRACTRVDARELADRLVGEFGSFAAILGGSSDRLRRVGADEGAIAALRWCRSAVSLSLRETLVERPVIATSSAMLDYLQFELSSETVEGFRTLYLNAGNELLADDATSAGTVGATPFYPREIIRRALELGATSLILAHNHPSGNPKPSPDDVACTRRLATLCEGLGIALLDHVIVGGRRAVSLRVWGALGT